MIHERNIFNVDESGFTICHKSGKILAKKGERVIGALTSSEKGNNVTIVACVSVTGVYVPPMMIFPSVRMKQELLDRWLPGSIGHANKSGLSQNGSSAGSTISLKQPSHRTENALFILDVHSCHTKNIKVIYKARDNNVVILSLPSDACKGFSPST